MENARLNNGNGKISRHDAIPNGNGLRSLAEGSSPAAVDPLAPPTPEDSPICSDAGPAAKTISELFSGIHAAIATHACLTERSSNLLCFWALSTWFSDGLSLAPGLVIIGPASEGVLVLRTLRNFCRYPVMLTSAEATSLKNAKWITAPTLLLSDPCGVMQMTAILSCTTRRGSMLGPTRGGYPYGPKAILVEEEVSIDRIPQRILQVRLQPVTTSKTPGSLPFKESAVQDLRKHLIRYRTGNLNRVYHSDFDAFALTSDVREVANALGACIDSPELQAKLVSLLEQVETRRELDTSIESATREGLNRLHENKAQVLFNQISTDVSRVNQSRRASKWAVTSDVSRRLPLGRSGRSTGVDPPQTAASASRLP